MFTLKRITTAIATFATVGILAVLSLTLFVPQTLQAGKPTSFLCCSCDNPADCAPVIDRFEARSYCYARWSDTGAPLGGTCYDKNSRLICSSCGQ